ncbi:MAG: ATP-binding protein [Coxiellaceae bacterium]|nr:ATP-binding protein [Coxiellaceae bacterium]
MKKYLPHNRFLESLKTFQKQDPQLVELDQLTYQFRPDWWKGLSADEPGIYILTGGRQIGKSTSCKLLIEDWLQNKKVSAQSVFYLPCDEVFDAKQLGQIIREFLEGIETYPFLLIIDEITFVPEWQRVIKSLADSGAFAKGLCLLTGSDSLILKEAAMSFPGRRGKAAQTDFHLFPLSFKQYVDLVDSAGANDEGLLDHYKNFLQCGGYLRAINDLADHGEITSATYTTYEQWIRGDFLRKGKNEDYLLAILHSLFDTAGTQVSYSGLTQKTGLMSKETFIDYCQILMRMDVIFQLQAFDQNNKRAFPKKAVKIHFVDPFIANTINRWLEKEGLLHEKPYESELVEATVASQCYRHIKTFYYKSQGEVDVLTCDGKHIEAIEVKWANQVRPADFKTLKNFHNALILKKQPGKGNIDNIAANSVYQWLYQY